jgi:hypothetical protein
MFLIYEILVNVVLTKTKKNKSVLERGIIYMYIFPKGIKLFYILPITYLWLWYGISIKHPRAMNTL